MKSNKPENSEKKMRPGEEAVSSSREEVELTAGQAETELTAGQAETELTAGQVEVKSNAEQTKAEEKRGGQWEKLLSPRLRVIGSMVPGQKSVADIGCDHAYLAIHLAMHEPDRRVFAMDVRRGPLSRAEENIRKAGLTDRITIRLSDGFQALSPGETEAAVLAGMGGGLIAGLLIRGKSLFLPGYTLVLSPQSEPEKVRRFLREEGFAILQEELVTEEGKFYPVIMAEKSFRGNCAVESTEKIIRQESAAGRVEESDKRDCAVESTEEIIRQESAAGRAKESDIEAGRLWISDHLGERLLRNPDSIVDRWLEKELGERLQLIRKLEDAEGSGAAGRRSELTREANLIRLAMGVRKEIQSR